MNRTRIETQPLDGTEIEEPPPPRRLRHAERRAITLAALRAAICEGRWPDPATVRIINEWCTRASNYQMHDLLEDLLPGATR